MFCPNDGTKMDGIGDGCYRCPECESHWWWNGEHGEFVFADFGTTCPGCEQVIPPQSEAGKCDGCSAVELCAAYPPEDCGERIRPFKVDAAVVEQLLGEALTDVGIKDTPEDRRRLWLDALEELPSTLAESAKRLSDAAVTEGR